MTGQYAHSIDAKGRLFIPAALRRELGWPPRMNAVAQPWTVQEEKTEHTVRLRFTVRSEIHVENALLALEGAAKRQFELACRAENLWGLCLTRPLDAGWSFRSGPVILK